MKAWDGFEVVVVVLMGLGLEVACWGCGHLKGLFENGMQAECVLFGNDAQE